MSRKHCEASTISRPAHWLRLPLCSAALAAVLLTLPVFVPQASAAGADDLKQDIVAISKTQELDLKTNKVLFIGNVEITQGSIRILADRLEVFRTADGKNVERMIAYGSLASFSQRLEDGTPVKAEGKKLQYEMREQTLLIDGSAQLSHANNLMNGQRIRYDLANEKFTAESSGSDANDRVTTIFLPPAPEDKQQ